MDNIRHFILTHGRSGSSLLCAVLADAGAEFDMATPASWERDVGEMEHPRIDPIQDHMAAWRRLGVWKPGGLSKYLWTWHRYRSRVHLQGLLTRASYVKTNSAVAGMALGLGYEIRIILNIRRFGLAAASHFNSHPARMSYAYLKQSYQEVLTTGLFLLNRHGGCVIDFEDLTDGENDAWAKALSQVTGLDTDRLLVARNERLASNPRIPRVVVEDRELDAIYEQARRHANKQFS